MQPDKNSKASHWFIVVAVCSCVLQLLWFASKCFKQIDFDGMAYLGIARHLRQGEFHAAIDAFRSPLISWLIAVASFGSTDYLHIGKLINIGAFLLSLALLHVLTEKLWHSKLTASVAVLMFALGRGLSAAAVEMITPDFLFAALTLIYFIVLLRCLRKDRLQDWFSLAFIHGLAFLAKAFALPWLAVCTLVALGLSVKPWKTKAARLGLAALIPVMVATGWATVLHSKYGVFTTGTQFKVNLLQWTLHTYSEHRDTTYSLLRDTSKVVDEYGVGDPMPPGSWPWTYSLNVQQVLPQMIRAEARNVPRVLKESMIVATLGGLFAFITMFAILTHRRHQYPVEWRFAVVIVASALSLVFAYSMLVFDERYLYPLIPLVLALAAFVAWELRAPAPMLPMRFFASRSFAVTNVVSFAMYFGMFGSIFFLSQFIQNVLGNSALEAGLKLLVWTGATMVVAPLAGIYSERIGSRPFMVAGLALQAIALGWLASEASVGQSYLSMLVPFVLAGAGMALVFAPSASAVLNSVRTEEAGQASGATNAIRELGGTFGIAVLATVFSSAGGYGSPQAFVDGMVPALWVGAAVLGAGALVATLMPSGRRAGEEAAEPLAGQALPPDAALSN